MFLRAKHRTFSGLTEGSRTLLAWQLPTKLAKLDNCSLNLIFKLFQDLRLLQLTQPSLKHSCQRPIVSNVNAKR